MAHSSKRNYRSLTPPNSANRRPVATECIAHGGDEYISRPKVQRPDANRQRNLADSDVLVNTRQAEGRRQDLVLFLDR